MARGDYNPVIYDYLRKYQEDPSSRVFAPLAEAYRKAGLVEEAIEIAREGLKVHPAFVGGRVALARALFDKKKYAEVVGELTRVVRDVPDNLVAQRLLAESCLMLGQVTEALGAYKMLLYFAPDDIETARLVQELESQAYEKGALILRTDPTQTAEPLKSPAEEGFAERPAARAIEQDPQRAEMARKAKYVRRIELLQTLLQRVERYRTRHPGRPGELAGHDIS